MKKIWLFPKIPCFVCIIGGFLLLGACTSSGTKTADTRGIGSQTGQAQLYQGLKARIAVARLQNKSGNKFWYSPSIGDGMADQLTSALFNSNRFIVLERQTLGDVPREQDTSAPIGQGKGADLLVVGAVSDFKDKASGSQGGGVLGAITGGFKKANIAIDLRMIDAKTSRVLAETTVEGASTDSELGTALGGGPLGGALEEWKNSPMEQALRSAINQSVEFIAVKTPQAYYRHRDSSARGNRRLSIPRSPLVREMQTILNSLGYDAGDADGIMGNKTRLAVSVFQRNNGLIVTGMLDSDTVARLRKIAAR